MKYLAKKFQYYRQSKLVPWDAQNAWGSWMPEGLGANTKKNRKLPGTWQNSFWTTIGKIGLKLTIGGFWTRTIFCNYTKKCWNVTFENCPKWPKWIENCSGVDLVVETKFEWLKYLNTGFGKSFGNRTFWLLECSRYVRKSSFEIWLKVEFD